MKIEFKSLSDDEEYEVSVDGEVIFSLREDEMDISDCALNPLWEKLGIELSFS